MDQQRVNIEEKHKMSEIPWREDHLRRVFRMLGLTEEQQKKALDQLNADPPTLKLGVYNKKPLSVNAVRVTAENMELVSDFCGGKILTHLPHPKDVVQQSYQYILVPVKNPVSEKHRWARVGDWVLQNRLRPEIFKVYTPGAFSHDFDFDFWAAENFEPDEFGDVIGADPEASNESSVTNN